MGFPKFVKELPALTTLNDTDAVMIDTGTTDGYVTVSIISPVKKDGTSVKVRTTGDSFEGKIKADSLNASDGADILLTGTIAEVSLESGKVKQSHNTTDFGVYQTHNLSIVGDDVILTTGGINLSTFSVNSNYETGEDLILAVWLTALTGTAEDISVSWGYLANDSIPVNLTALPALSVVNSSGSTLAKKLLFSLPSASISAGRHYSLKILTDAAESDCTLIGATIHIPCRNLIENGETLY